MVEENKEATKLTCGIVMPISLIDGLGEEHWIDVLEIVSESVRTTQFEPSLVSSAEDIGVIQKRIIQNLYDNPIVVCDVSAKNPNVMFELGLRLAFDKPTIIIKDDKTSYSFDTSPIEHLTYPRDLRFNEIVRFKERLADKLKATYEKSQTDKNFTPFLGHFGTFTVAKLDSKEVPGSEFIIEQLKELREQIASNRPTRRPESEFNSVGKDGRSLNEFAAEAKRAIRRYCKEKGVSIKSLDAGDFSFISRIEDEAGAPRYFHTPGEYRRYLSMLLTTM